MRGFVLGPFLYDVYDVTISSFRIVKVAPEPSSNVSQQYDNVLEMLDELAPSIPMQSLLSSESLSRSVDLYILRTPIGQTHRDD